MFSSSHIHSFPFVFKDSLLSLGDKEPHSERRGFLYYFGDLVLSEASSDSFLNMSVPGSGLLMNQILSALLSNEDLLNLGFNLIKTIQ